MTKENAIKIAKQYFDNHKSVEAFFITTDEQAFFSEQAAKNHAGSLPKDSRDIVQVLKDEAFGDNAKAAEAKAKKISKIKVDLEKTKAAVADATKKVEAETNEKKKATASLTLQSLQAKATELQTQLEALESE